MQNWGEWYQAIGLERDGRIIASVLFNEYSGAGILMHVAAAKGTRWATHGFLRACFDYPFGQLGCTRVTGLVPAKNKDVLRFDLHLGFKREGRIREALPDDDLIVIGMLKRECRWYGQR